jgi:predicted O-methyltransferase YrrM
MSIKDEVGRILYAICGLTENKTIVEIGTWNGLGSSTVIARGVNSGKQNAQVY